MNKNIIGVTGISTGSTVGKASIETDSVANQRIENNFTYHKPINDQQKRYIILRETAKDLAFKIQVNCPDSREKSLAFTKLEEAIMWANASIARNEKE